MVIARRPISSACIPSTPINAVAAAVAKWPPEPMPITPECALAQYATHAICKMNANFGFGQHTPGLGRQPASEAEVSRYFEQLGKALVEAIERDFDEPDRRFGVRCPPGPARCGNAPCAPALTSLALGWWCALSQNLACLTAGQIQHVGRVHLSGLVLYQTELGNALAAANREGEEARREERLRIWGYA